MGKIGKAEIVAAIVSQGAAKQKAEDIYKAIGECLCEVLQQGDEINLFGLATITPVTRKARTGRNPKTGEAIQIPAKRALKIKLRQAGKDALASEPTLPF